MTPEEKSRKVKPLRPIDDVFFEVLADDLGVCEEILQTILEDAGLRVTDVVVQSSQRNLYGRSVRLDALCTLGDGTKCNIEVQRANDDDHLRRVRFNASMITAKESDAGAKFEDIAEVYVVFISEKDFLKGGKTIYHIDKVLRETGKVVDDGLHEMFVNAEIKDGTDISELMTCFMQTKVENEKFQKLSNRMRFLKEDEGGVSAVCAVMQKYEDLARAEGRQEGRQEGESLMAKLIAFLLAKGLTEEAKRAASDEKARQEMYRKYGILE